MQQKTRSIAHRLSLAATLGLGLLLAACVGLLPPPLTPGAAPAPIAAQLARQGSHAQAAAAYEALAARSAPAAQAALQLTAAREWLAAARPADAARVLRAITAPLSDAQAYERGLLEAQVSLDERRALLAWRQITALPAASEPAAALEYYTLRMRIALAAARAVDGIRAELAAERYASSDAQRTGLRGALLQALLAARQSGVNLDPRVSADPLVRGWLELGATATQSRSMSINSAALAARWRARYPDHPALTVLAQAFPAPLASAVPGARVALLLPLSGTAAAWGATVRDGFLSALYQLPPGGRPQLHVYDSASMPVTQAFAQARADGSSFIVGPLLPEEVSAVAALGAEPVPVLALNFLPDGQPAPSGLYQFALSPEEEAQMAAQRILADGHRHGIMMVPRNDWGTRVASAFARALTLGGGSVIAAPTFDPEGHDYGDELKSVLRIDDSEARHQRLQRVLGTKLNFEPRHRGDIEFVFIVAQTSINARLIEPQLRYSYAGDIPSYSISNAYEPDTLDSNRDIAGLMYPDMPWMIATPSNVTDLRRSIGEAWGNRTDWRSRLFAFGYDACQLMLAMSAPYGSAGAVQIDGLTGQLHFDADRRVQRELVWVRVNGDGDPTPLAATAPPAPIAP